MATEKTSVVLPPPPPNRQRRAQITIALVVLGGAGLALFSGGLASAAALVAGGGALQWLLLRTRRQEVGSHLALAALDRAARGRFAEARALLDAVPTNVHGSVVGQMVFSQRAALALYEGHLDDAVSFATIAAKEGERLNATERIHQGSALSIRAVAQAGLGNKAEALSDAAKVRTAEFRQGGFVARAALAEALVHAREKDLDALAEVLREERPLLFGATGPRERLIARSLARLVAAKKVSVYREAAKRDDEQPDAQASWVAKLAPDAAAFARSPALGEPLDAPEEVSAEARAVAEKAAPKAKSHARRVLVLWVLLILVFLAVWQFLAPTTPPPRAVHAAPPPTPGETWASLGGLYAGVILLVAGWIAYKVREGKRLSVTLGNAMETRLRGKLEEAAAIFTPLTKSKVVLVAPQAYRELATIATMNGEFRDAQAHAEAGIASTKVSAVALAHAQPVLLPALHAELAAAFAAEGRTARAEEELETIRVGFPTYPFLARDTFRIRLLAATAQGRLDEAAAMARSRPVDLPLTMDEELLCDLLRVHAGDPLPEGERERIEADVRDDPRAARFLDRVAPTLRSAALRHGPRIAYEPEPPEGGAAAPGEQEATEEEAEDAGTKKALGLTP